MKDLGCRELSPPEGSSPGDPDVHTHWALLHARLSSGNLWGLRAATLSRPLFAGGRWVLLQEDCGEEGGVAGLRGRQGRNEVGSGLGPASLGTVPGVRWRFCTHRHLSPAYLKGTLQLHYPPQDWGWLLGKRSVF